MIDLNIWLKGAILSGKVLQVKKEIAVPFIHGRHS